MYSGSRSHRSTNTHHHRSTHFHLRSNYPADSNAHNTYRHCQDYNTHHRIEPARMYSLQVPPLRRKSNFQIIFS